MLTLVAFIVVFGTIVFFHELGHFTVAKLAGIRVYEFALGFGPLLASRTRGETKYSLRIFPLGGFVRMAGMDEAADKSEELGEEEASRSFQNKSLPWRLATIAAGPLMNFVLAVILFTLYFMLVTVPPTISQIEPDSPAEIAGLQVQDSFVAVNGEKIDHTEQVIELIKASPERELELTILRKKELIKIQITPRQENGEGKIGVGISISKPRYPLLISVKGGFTQTWAVTSQLVKDLARMITGKQKADISGPIGIVQIVGETARQGLPDLLILAIILNINLGLLNLLPIPVLDGGWLVILVVEAVRGKPLSPEARGVVQFIGLALLVLLMIFATFKDLSRFKFFS